MIQTSYQADISINFYKIFEKFANRTYKIF